MRPSLYITGSIIIAINLFVLYGVHKLDWSIGDLLILYWIESVIIGLTVTCKLALSQNTNAVDSFLSIFFPFHYGMFAIGHLIFLLFMFGEYITYSHSLLYTSIAIAGSYGISLLLHFLKTEEREQFSPVKALLQTYPRVIIMHTAVVIGSFYVLANGNAFAVITILVIGKTFFDLLFHLLEHRNASAGSRM